MTGKLPETLTLHVNRCPHGAWHPHNAFQLPDGSIVDDPEGPCAGGVIELVDGRRFHMSHAFAMTLDAFYGEES